jgi:hypothetical protein
VSQMWPLRRKTRFPDQPRPTAPIDYPDGLAVDTEDGVWYIRSRMLFRVYSPRVLESWAFKPVRGSTKALSGFKRGGVLGFRDGTLIHNIADGKMYLVSGNKRRHIRNPDSFEHYGLEYHPILQVSDKETNLHDEGPPIE